jgi:branched-subunit amino acid transport protein
MTSQYVWIVIVSLMAMVLGMRWSFLILPRRFQPRGALAQALSFAPLAALMAVCAPELFKFRWLAWQGADAAPTLTLSSDWRFWGALTMLLVVTILRQSKSASLFGLMASALVVFLIG